MQTLTPELRNLLTQLSQHLAVSEKSSELNLLSLWSQYKIAKKNLVAATTQKGDWIEVDRALAAVSLESLEFSASAASLFLKQSHSHYLGYVKFLALTGFRPEEAIALCWADIKGSEIVVSKAYSQGILKVTKTYEARSFPVNSQLAQLLKSLPKKQNLVFPSVESGHINQHNFNERYWKPIVKQLVASGKVNEYLPTNNLRHSWITRMLRSGLDIATVARLAGNKPDTIMRHYLAAQTRDLILPDL
jgi:integrase